MQMRVFLVLDSCSFWHRIHLWSLSARVVVSQFTPGVVTPMNQGGVLQRPARERGRRRAWPRRAGRSRGRRLWCCLITCPASGSFRMTTVISRRASGRRRQVSPTGCWKPAWACQSGSRAAIHYGKGVSGSTGCTTGMILQGLWTSAISTRSSIAGPPVPPIGHIRHFNAMWR